ncbi:MAG TPA: DUF1684 domain-containing protein [Candidatus Acidoferrum sp.]|nr:DUF1684 domain-containing protein [Candidatus Acidoferrum sp.]
MAKTSVQPYLDLADWRRRVGDLYRLSGPDAPARFRNGRDELFRTHPQSPLSEEARSRFNGLRYFDHDPVYRIGVRVESADEGDPLEIDTGGEDGVITYRRAGWLRFRLGGEDCRLTIVSLVGYGGGLFLPFRDATSGHETYGGGRYLFDTVKNTDGLALDLRAGSPDITIDFNFAYNPSCVYDARWACPLAPRENWLPVPVRAGEKMFP